MSSNKVVNIEITSDSICPWCYVGKRRLERAISEAKEQKLPLDFKISFKPFLLDPTLGTEPVNKMDRYKAKFGVDRLPRMVEYMKSIGKEEGINFSYGGDMSQTTDSHRLIALAEKEGGEQLQNKVVNALFRAYFEQEQNVGSLDVLVNVAKEAGMDSGNVRAYLLTDQGTAEVKRDIEKAYNKGVTGVPFFTVDNKYGISGAQEPGAFVELFEELAGKA